MPIRGRGGEKSPAHHEKRRGHDELHGRAGKRRKDSVKSPQWRGTKIRAPIASSGGVEKQWRNEERDERRDTATGSRRC